MRRGGNAGAPGHLPPGDTVAIGSPVYYTFLNSIQELGLKVLEIPSTPREGMSVDALAYALRQPVRACLVIANFNNPLGSGHAGRVGGIACGMTGDGRGV